MRHDASPRSPPPVPRAVPPGKPVCKYPSTKVPPLKTLHFCPCLSFFLDAPLSWQLENSLPFFATLLTCHQLRAFLPCSLHPQAKDRHASFVPLQHQTVITCSEVSLPSSPPCRSLEGMHVPLPHACGPSAQWAQRRSPANTMSIPCFLLP